MKIIVWIRNDLRIEDNPALLYAMQTSKEVIALYIWHENIGKRSRSWLKKAISSFQESVHCIVREGDPLEVLQKVLSETKAKALFWNRRYEPENIKIDATVEKSLPGITIKTFAGNVLFEPGTILNRSGKPFQVFTPFWNVVKRLTPDTPQDAVTTHTYRPDPLKYDEEPSLWHYWEPTEKKAKALVREFIQERLSSYEEARNYPARFGTSKLSPYLHFGELSVKWLWAEILRHGGEFYLRELAWREFAIHLLYHYPHMPYKPLDAKFQKFPWICDKTALRAWQEGKTGYPIVDAGMRELKETGWMHNRVRMIVGSFLVKHLLLPWQEGEKWFWELLVDADLANNSMGWQWIAGCGADAAPYFRIFNPVLQGKKFDPEGIYVKRYVPELEAVPIKYIHTPWECKNSYVPPIVDHKIARERALKAFNTLIKR